MAKKIIGILAIIVFIVGIVVTLNAVELCRDYFSKCIDGGCGSVISAQDCRLRCLGGSTLDCNSIENPIE
jgi:hypothetical protein